MAFGISGCFVCTMFIFLGLCRIWYVEYFFLLIEVWKVSIFGGVVMIMITMIMMKLDCGFWDLRRGIREGCRNWE